MRSIRSLRRRPVRRPSVRRGARSAVRHSVHGGGGKGIRRSKKSSTRVLLRSTSRGRTAYRRQQTSARRQAKVPNSHGHGSRGSQMRSSAYLTAPAMTRISPTPHGPEPRF